LGDMYLAHYHLKRMPFQLNCDPSFLWLGEKHERALSILKYGVTSNQGFLLLTGDVGTGKTTLINAMVNGLYSDTCVINVTDPRLDKLDFFRLIMHTLGFDTPIRTKFDFITSFGNFLRQAREDRKRVLLIIDEAQKLSLDSLEEIRLLSNIERHETKLINIFFIGQDELNETITRPECRALRQRITIVHHIEPLNSDETADYVQHRLMVAGTRQEIFTGEALEEIYRFSKGCPRLINNICDRAMMAGYTDGLQTIGADIIRKRARDLTIPGEAGQETSEEVGGRRRSGIRRASKPAMWLSLLLVAVFCGYGIVSLFLEKSRSRSYSVHGDLSALIDPRNTPPVSAMPQTAEPAPALPGPSRGEMNSHQASFPSVREDDPREVGSHGHVKSSGTVHPSGNSRWVVPFGYDTNDLPPESLVKLDEVAGDLLLKTDLNVVIKGYTDSGGNNEYNRNLSIFRANVVKSYLTGKGIDPARMKVVGMGDATPLKSNTSPEGRVANRRVEVEVVSGHR
jgi:general secretion pathway protein A